MYACHIILCMEAQDIWPLKCDTDMTHRTDYVYTEKFKKIRLYTDAKNIMPTWHMGRK